MDRRGIWLAAAVSFLAKQAKTDDFAALVRRSLAEVRSQAEPGNEPCEATRCDGRRFLTLVP
jgi:hypothetical protein